MRNKSDNTSITFLEYSPPEKTWKSNEIHHKHLKERFKERYNVIITDKEIKDLIANIKEQLKNEDKARKITQTKLRLVVRNSSKSTYWKILFKENHYIIVYDELASVIKTVLPKDNIQHYIHVTKHQEEQNGDRQNSDTLL